jgi:hypothetical protein
MGGTDSGTPFRYVQSPSRHSVLCGAADPAFGRIMYRELQAGKDCPQLSIASFTFSTSCLRENGLGMKL